MPTTTFDGAPIWTVLPDAAEIERRRAVYFQPYHDALAAEIARVKAAHGYAVLWDCHSIKSVIPRLFPGTLPTLNLGTNSGQSCAPAVEAAAAAAMAAQPLTHVVNGRFKGGWHHPPLTAAPAEQCARCCRWKRRSVRLSSPRKRRPGASTRPELAAAPCNLPSPPSSKPL